MKELQRVRGKRRNHFTFEYSASLIALLLLASPGLGQVHAAGLANAGLSSGPLANDNTPTIFVSDLALSQKNMILKTAVIGLLFDAAYAGDAKNQGSTGTSYLAVASKSMTGIIGGGQKRTTSTSVSCSPSSLPVNVATTCKATVTDTASGARSTPTGTVTFSQNPLHSGYFSSPTCTLSLGSCSVTYTPSPGHEGQPSLTASYGGDARHRASSASISITATKRTVSVSIVCSPASVRRGSSTTCSVSVIDLSSGITVGPTGTIALSASIPSAGSFSSSKCTLSSGSCSVAYRSSVSGGARVVIITASYSGDTDHFPGSASFSFTVT
jgi:hypothetical protein